MMFNFECPLNPLSFGHISFGIFHEFYKRNLFPNYFPIGQPDLSVYNNVGPDFHNYVGNCIKKSLKNYKKDIPSLKQWHCNGSHGKISEPSYLLTFYECSQPTDEEINILNQYSGIFLTSNYSKEVFQNAGVQTPIHIIKLGFDDLHYKRTEKPYYNDGSIVFSIFGKMECLRKAHEKTIRAWVKKYGNDKKYRLHLFLNNPFIKPEDLNKIYSQIFNNDPIPANVVLYGYQATDSLMNDAYNCTDIVIDMSRSESLSLPSLVCLSLGKWGVIHNATAMKDWATDQNSVLINSNSKIPANDGMFFIAGTQFNQGSFFDWDEEEFLVGCDKAIERFKINPRNIEGEKLKDIYSFKNGVDSILQKMQILV